MKRHRVESIVPRRAEWKLLNRRNQPPPNRILFDISHTADKLLYAHNLTLVKAAHLYIELALQAEREAAIAELHGLFEQNVRSRRDQSVEVVRHDDERKQKKLPLPAIIEDGSLEQFCGGSHLKEPAALRGNRGDEVRTKLLWREPHPTTIEKKPAAKAAVLCGLGSGA
ncbi:MAG TPA: hypothetical protein VMU71_06170 [Terracidiphilus sp.]|nr:hypothetical protein [Terracidiphilus sp.]